MVIAYQPLVRLVCLLLLTVRLVAVPDLESGPAPEFECYAEVQEVDEPVTTEGVEAAGVTIFRPDSPTQLVQSSSKAAPAPKRTSRTLRRVCRVTAYCDQGLTASGVPVRPGHCAAPAYIPFGARVYIPALGRSFIVTDRTHPRFRHNTVDIFISSKDRCVEFGRRYLKCDFILPAAPQPADIRVASR